MQRVSEWLETLGLGRYVPVFAAHAIELDVLPEYRPSGTGSAHRTAPQNPQSGARAGDRSRRVRSEQP